MKTIKTRLPALLLSLSLLAGCAGSSSKSQTEGSQSQEIPTSGVQSTQEEKGGVELNIMTTVGPSVVAAIAKNAQLYEEQTGNRVTISEIPQEDMFSKLAQAAATKSTDFDMFLAPSSWKASLSELGYVQVLDDYIERDKDDPDFDWNDVPHGMKIRNMWNGENYCITVDGDVLIMIYRRDVFEDEQWKQAFRQENDKELRVPQTMDELIEVCQFFKGKDWAGDGKPEEHFPFLTAVTKGGHSNYYKAEVLKVIKGSSAFSRELLSGLIERSEKQAEQAKSEIQEIEKAKANLTVAMAKANQQYHQVLDWSELYDKSTTEAKKMILAQLIDRVTIKKGYQVDIAFSVSYEQFMEVCKAREEKAQIEQEQPTPQKKKRLEMVR